MLINVYAATAHREGKKIGRANYKEMGKGDAVMGRSYERTESKMFS